MSTTEPTPMAPTPEGGPVVPPPSPGPPPPKPQPGQPGLSLPTGQLTSPRAVGMQAPLGPTDAQGKRMPGGMPVPSTVMHLTSDSEKHPQIAVVQDFDGQPSGAANIVLKMLQDYLLTPYLHGGADPRKGVDSQRFFQFMFAREGTKLPYTMPAQSNAGQVVRSHEELEPGDLVFLTTPGRVEIKEQGINLGQGQFLHIPKGHEVKISTWTDPYYANRFLKGTRVPTGQPQGSPSVPPAGNSANYVAREGGEPGTPNAPSDPNAYAG